MKENKLIAEFMGYEECPNNLFKMGDEFQSFKICSEYQDEDEYNTISAGARIIKFTSEQMEFHTSWDWLMPVVEKINNILDDDDEFIYSVNIHPSKVTIYFYQRDIFVSNEHGGTLISMVYNAVVEFINRYNQNRL